MTDPEDLPCIELVELVTEHLDGALDPATTARYEEHLAECEACREHVDQIRRTVSLLRDLPQDERLSPQARARLIGEFRAVQGGSDR